MYSPQDQGVDPFAAILARSGSQIREQHGQNLQTLGLGDSWLAKADNSLNDQRREILAQVKEAAVKTGGSL